MSEGIRSSIILTSASGSGITKYPNFAGLPALAANGDLGITIDNDYLYVYNGAAWVLLSSPSGAITGANSPLAISGNLVKLVGGASADMAADLNLGTTYGIRATYLGTSAASPAAAGVIRLAKTEKISFRNNAGSADNSFSTDTSDFFTLDSGLRVTTTSGNSLQMIRSGYKTYGFQQSSGTGIAFRNITDSLDQLFFEPVNNRIGFGGITTPQVRFHFDNSSSTQANIQLTNSTSGAASSSVGFRTILDTNDLTLTNFQNGFFLLRTNSADVIKMDSDQSVTMPHYGAGVAHFSSAGLLSSSAVVLTSEVSGILPIANGGTNAATTSQNFVFAGPTSGSGAPAFRALVAGDIPSLSATYLPLSGGTMSGNIAMGSNAISGATTFTGTGASSFGSVAFTSSSVPTDGFYLPSASTIGLAIASSQILKVTASGITPTNNGTLTLGDATHTFVSTGFGVMNCQTFTATGATGVVGFPGGSDFTFNGHDSATSDNANKLTIRGGNNSSSGNGGDLVLGAGTANSGTYGNLSLQVRGSTLQFLDGTNNRIGFGLSTPRVRYHFDNNGSTQINVQFTNSSTGAASSSVGFLLQLNVDTLNLNNQQNGDTVILNNGNESARFTSDHSFSTVGTISYGTTRVVATDGGTTTIADNIGHLILDPAGALATYTINMPANPKDKSRLEISAGPNGITTVTHNAGAGQTLNGALTTLAANGAAAWKYLTATTSWYRTT